MRRTTNHSSRTRGRPRRTRRPTARRPSTSCSGGPTPNGSDRSTFGTRLTIALIAAAILPLSVFGILLVLAQPLRLRLRRPRLLLLAIILTALTSSLAAYLQAADLTAPLRAIAAAVDRAKAGDLTMPIDLPGDDELARLAGDRDRLAAASTGATASSGGSWRRTSTARHAKASTG